MAAIQPASMVDLAAVRLRDAILSGEFRPGEPVRVAELQKEWGVSHIPIREAIRKLEAEGLVVSRARRAPIVAEVNLGDLAAVYDLRRLIELPTAARAHEGRTPPERTLTMDAYRRFEAVAHDPYEPAYWECHTAFHWAIIEGGVNTWTRRTLEPLWTAAERYVRLFVSTYATPEATLELHRSLLDAYLEDDTDQFVRALEHHFAITEAGVRAGISQEEGRAAAIAANSEAPNCINAAKHHRPNARNTQ